MAGPHADPSPPDRPVDRFWALRTCSAVWKLLAMTNQHITDNLATGKKTPGRP